ncbi:hypothetical protein RQP46_000917 [Phenoliferia psychrophenolica]
MTLNRKLAHASHAQHMAVCNSGAADPNAPENSNPLADFILEYELYIAVIMRSYSIITEEQITTYYDWNYVLVAPAILRLRDQIAGTIQEPPSSTRRYIQILGISIALGVLQLQQHGTVMGLAIVPLLRRLHRELDVLRDASYLLTIIGGTTIIPLCSNIVCIFESALTTLVFEVFPAAGAESAWRHLALVRYLCCLKAFALFTEHEQFSATVGGTHFRALLLQPLDESSDWLDLVTEGARQCLSGYGPLVEARFDIGDLQKLATAFRESAAVFSRMDGKAHALEVALESLVGTEPMLLLQMRAVEPAAGEGLAAGLVACAVQEIGC